MRWCNVQTNEYDPQAKTYPTICTHHKLHNNNENKIPWMYIQQVTEYDVTNISGTQPRKNELQIYPFNHLNRKATVEHIRPHTLYWQWKVIDRTSSMLNTSPQNNLHNHLHLFNACEQSCIIMMIMGSSKMSKEYDLKAIMYPAYDTSHKLCNVVCVCVCVGGGGGGGGETSGNPDYHPITQACLILFSRGGGWGVHRPWRRDLAMC